MPSNSSNRKFPRVIIIGAGFGGIEVAKKLKIRKLKVWCLTEITFILFNH